MNENLTNCRMVVATEHNFSNITLAEIIEGVKKTFDDIKFDYEKELFTLGQVSYVEKREAGFIFTFNDHLRGLILSMLSNQRPWGPIAENMGKINDIFFDFHKEKILAVDKKAIAKNLIEIKCGNRAIYKQMDSLNYNISLLEKIEDEYGSLNEFVTSDVPDKIAVALGKTGKYKLKQIGYALAMEYLRNVGIPTIKPDVHIKRMIGRNRLNLCTGLSESEVVDVLTRLSNEEGINLTYADNLIWMFCAVSYGDICNDKPKCNVCRLRNSCNYENIPVEKI